MCDELQRYEICRCSGLDDPAGGYERTCRRGRDGRGNCFQSQCAMCHGVTPGAAGIGPSVAGVYGKPAASVPGYQYSPALIAAKLVWNDATLDKFLTSPQSDVPGTKMPFAGMTDAGQRADVIAYLATLKGS